MTLIKVFREYVTVRVDILVESTRFVLDLILQSDAFVFLWTNDSELFTYICHKQPFADVLQNRGS